MGGREAQAGSYITIGEVPFGHTSNKVCKEKRKLWAKGGEAGVRQEK